WLGTPLAAILLSATQLLLPCWLKLTVVLVPTLKDCQFSKACGAIWLIVTTVWPLLLVCVGVLAPTQVVTGFAAPEPASPLSGTKPPAARPFGTVLGVESARLRAALCTACIAWMACVARVSAFIDCAAAAAACAQT